MAKPSFSNGILTLDAATQSQLIQLVNLAGQNRNAGEARAMAALLAEPINQVAAYQEFSSKVMVNKQINPGDDQAIPLDEYTVTAYLSSLDGRVRRARSGLLNTRPDFFTIKSGFEMSWHDMELATWNVLGRRMMQVGDEIARVRDRQCYSVLRAAAESVSHIVQTTGGVLARNSVDALFKIAAAANYPIRRVFANEATLMDMRSSQFFTWDSNKTPLAYGDTSLVKEIMTKGYVGDYDGAEWFTSNAFSAGSSFGAGSGGNATNLAAVTSGAAIVLYVGEPADVGLNVQRGSVREASDVDIDNETNRYRFSETRFFYCGNPYRVWVQVITT